MSKEHILFIIGWILSPFTWWNDVLINIPISYLLASLTSYFLPKFFVHSVVIYYWLTNILGIFLMFKAGKELIRQKKINLKTIIFTIISMVIYSIILIIFERMSFIKPFKMDHVF